jgi:hypothetical protein
MWVLIFSTPPATFGKMCHYLKRLKKPPIDRVGFSKYCAKMARGSRRLPKWQALQILYQTSQNIFGMKLALANVVPNSQKKEKSFVKIS